MTDPTPAGRLSETQLYEQLAARLIGAEQPTPGVVPKPWWRSTTILGAAAVLLSQAAALAGYSLDAGQLVDLGTSLVGFIGGAAALWGRLHAVQPIGR